jgi:hypothetical protein
MRKTIILIALAGAGTAHAQQVQPGLWESTSRMTAISAPNMPPEATAAMTRRPPTIYKQCIRPADAAKGFQEMLKDKSQSCSVKSSRYVDGVLDIVSQCSAQGQTSTMHMHGPYSATAYTLTSDMTMNNAEMPMKMSVQIAGKRLGPCN